jgi:hypothetical protein
MMRFRKYFPARDDGAPALAENSKKSEKGAIAVEYAFGMLLAAFFMMGVEVLFRRMAVDIIHFFKQLVTQFPNI